MSGEIIAGIIGLVVGLLIGFLEGLRFRYKRDKDGYHKHYPESRTNPDPEAGPDPCTWLHSGPSCPEAEPPQEPVA